MFCFRLSDNNNHYCQQLYVYKGLMSSSDNHYMTVGDRQAWLAFNININTYANTFQLLDAYLNGGQFSTAGAYVYIAYK